MLDKNKVEKFIAAAMKYKGNKYSQAKRMQPGYSDCSSLIYKGLRDAGLLDLSQTTKTISTRYIRDGDPRFERINMNQLQRGDILWWQRPNSSTYEGHVAIFLGNGRVLEAIYEGVVEKSSKRIPYQRAYRTKTLKATGATQPVEVTSASGDGTVKSGTLNVRSGNSTSYSVLGKLKKGAKVKITGKAGSWYRINYNGKHGFVSGQYIDLKPKKSVTSGVTVRINGTPLKTKCYIVDGISYFVTKGSGQDMEVRSTFEQIGAKVEWKNSEVWITL